MKCDSCNLESDYLQRINMTGEKGLFYCNSCLIDHANAIDQLKEMSPEELEKVPYTIVMWNCSGNKCSNGTKVRDYGAHPWYYRATKNPKWHNIGNNFWACAKHNKFCKRLLKNFSIQSVYNKLFNLKKQRITKIK